jgi:hypothetical protein
VDHHAVRDGLARIDHRQQQRVLHDHPLRGVLGGIPVLGDDDRDGLADVAHVVARDRRLEVAVETG